MLRRLADAEEPAIAIEETDEQSRGSNRHWHVELLPFGERLLRKEVDWLNTNTVERWVGGVRIASREPAWRYDAARDAVSRA